MRVPYRVGAGEVGPGVPGSGLEDGVPGAVVGPGDEPGAADEAADEVAHDRPVEVGQDHHVELPGVGDQLHAAGKGGQLATSPKIRLGPVSQFGLTNCR